MSGVGSKRKGLRAHVGAPSAAAAAKPTPTSSKLAKALLGLNDGAAGAVDEDYAHLLPNPPKVRLFIFSFSCLSLC